MAAACSQEGREGLACVRCSVGPRFLLVHIGAFFVVHLHEHAMVCGLRTSGEEEQCMRGGARARSRQHTQQQQSKRRRRKTGTKTLDVKNRKRECQAQIEKKN